jgi:LmbE family N-acetylglucosaminyl deacetylase
MVREAAFYSGLIKLESREKEIPQAAFRPQSVFMYIQDYYLNPTFVVDISGYWEKKIEILKCYSSQFYSADSTEPNTPISGEEFFEFLYGKALNYGRPCGFLLGEGFINDRYTGIQSISHAI